MRRKREDWLIRGSAFVCDDPAEALARLADSHGEAAEAAWTTIEGASCAFVTAMHAKLAWRFATAALDLDDLYAGDPTRKCSDYVARSDHEYR